MKGYSEREVFSPSDLEAFTWAKEIVAELPERDASGDLLRCHEVARVVSRVLHAMGCAPEHKVVDGHFEVGAEHSWIMLQTPVGKYRWWSILDTYVVGRIPPVQLIAVVSTLPLRYVSSSERTDIREDVIIFLLDYLGHQKNVCSSG